MVRSDPRTWLDEPVKCIVCGGMVRKGEVSDDGTVDGWCDLCWQREVRSDREVDREIRRERLGLDA